MNTSRNEQAVESLASLIRVVAGALNMPQSVLIEGVTKRLMMSQLCSGPKTIPGVAIVDNQIVDRPHRCAVHNVIYADGETCGICADTMIFRENDDPTPRTISEAIGQGMVGAWVARNPSPRGIARFPIEWINNNVKAWESFRKENKVLSVGADQSRPDYSRVVFVNRNGTIENIPVGVEPPPYDITFQVNPDRTITITYTKLPDPDLPIPVAGTCRACGCTDADCRDCFRLTGKVCTWIEPDLCSACSELIIKPL